MELGAQKEDTRIKQKQHSTNNYGKKTKTAHSKMAFFHGGYGGGGGGWVGGGGWGGGGGGTFETHFSVKSAAMAGRTNIEDGDKILLPPSALDLLSRLNVEYPMKFELTHEAGL